MVGQGFFLALNYALAAVSWSILGRLALGLMVRGDSSNYIWRAFVSLTNPVLAAVRLVTPLCVPPVLVMMFAIMWLYLLRVGLFFVLSEPVA